jgi:hypothetical protein
MTGAAYIIYGKITEFVLIDLGNLDPNDGYAIRGVSWLDCLGLSVSDAGSLCICFLSVKFLTVVDDWFCQVM